MPLRCFLVEDEPPARDILMRCIAERKDLELAGFSEDALGALEKIPAANPDILFVDVELPGMSGFEMLEQIASPPPVIFTTAGSAHAVPAFNYGAVDFLLKPFSRARFDQAVNRIQSLQTRRPGPGLAIREGENHYLIPFSEIIYLSSNGKSTAIHTTDRDFESARLIKELEAKLPGNFARIHKQYVLNLDFALSLRYRTGGGYTVLLRDSDETSLPAGRQYAQRLKQVFQDP